jgi:hypothetical protein
MTDLDELKRLCESATPRPWIVDTEYELAVTVPDGKYIAALTTEYGEEPYAHGTEANAALIVAMRNALPDLLSRLAAVEAERDAALARAEAAAAAAARLREALEYYASSDNWNGYKGYATDIWDPQGDGPPEDGWTVARAALAATGEQE